MLLLKKGRSLTITSDDRTKLVVLVNEHKHRAIVFNPDSLDKYNWYGWEPLTATQTRQYKNWDVVCSSNKLKTIKRQCSLRV